MTEKEELPTSAMLGNLSGLWRTRAARVIAHTIDACHRDGCMGVVTGPSGVGKTTAALAKVDALRNSSDEDDAAWWTSAHYVSLTAASAQMQPGLLRIAQMIGAIGAVRGSLSANDIHDSIIATLGRARSLLVVDEAQYASDPLLHCLRDIWDELKMRGGTASLILVGTSSLARRLRGGGAKARAFEPLLGRLRVWLELERPGTEDLSTIAQHFGLAGPEALRLIGQASASPGGLHTVHALMKAARALAGTEADLKVPHLMKASVAMGVIQ